nr:MAG TPA: hypothetical protein [Caudoviricetes sp.]
MSCQKSANFMLRHQRQNHLRFDYKKFFRGFLS